MGKTADLAMVQKTIIDKEGKSQKVITERGDCSQSWFKHLGELHKEIFLNQRQLQKHLTWAVEKKTGLLLSGPKSSFQIKVNFAFPLEIEVWSLEEEWRGTESKLLEVQCEVSEVSDDLGCCDVCWCWSTVFLSSPKSMQPSTRRFWSTLCFLLLTSFMEMLISFSSRTSAPAHTAKATSKWFADHYCAWFASQHAWPEPHMELWDISREDEK